MDGIGASALPAELANVRRASDAAPPRMSPVARLLSLYLTRLWSSSQRPVYSERPVRRS